jgi:hypothetical protein
MLPIFALKRVILIGLHTKWYAFLRQPDARWMAKIEGQWRDGSLGILGTVRSNNLLIFADKSSTLQ